ncbi:DNA damage-binding protein 1, DDB1 [Carpediemonas membranifera]|uniref:DNA damage-binding protein 1, DDB1 n=1 Tax=Carpediemonas membranifera TaxID=201153 RepID=A0A8J6B690_9EUKA|nr:DNA damage-binding protein 1, DDB1 [Carpediemonas membranifera]|eukprot:KAG9396543.1 DNA damage-binding protein 1, DDB1 [Carpediemonas membranifera]
MADDNTCFSTHAEDVVSQEARWYVVTKHPSSFISHALVGAFTHSEEDGLNLLLVKTGIVDVFDVTPDGLVLLFSIPIRGSIAHASLFKPRQAVCASLLVQTDKYNLLVIQYDFEMRRPVCKVSGDIRDKVGRPAETLTLAVNPAAAAVAVHAYSSMMKFFALPSQGQNTLESFNVRLYDDMTDVLDMCYLPQDTSDVQGNPTLLVLYADQSKARFIRTIAINFSEQAPVTGPMDVPIPVNSAVHRVFPIANGVITVSDELVTFYDPRAVNQQSVQSLPYRPVVVTAMAAVDASRVLMGDQAGRIYLLSLSGDSEIRVELLGVGSIPYCLAYVDSSVFFLGSFYGDSQLIRVMPEPHPDGSYLTVLETFPNIAPISDAVRHTSAQGSQQLITCSGGFQNGSLRVLRNGIGANELAVLETPPITGVWSITANPSPAPSVAVLSFVDRSVAMVMEDQIHPISIPGFDSTTRTVHAGVCGGLPVQVTPTGVNLLTDSFTHWSAPSPVRLAATDPGRNAQVGLVAVCTDSGVTVIDCAMAEVHSVQTSSAPSAVALSACIGRPVLAYACWFDRTVTLVDPIAQTVLATVTVATEAEVRALSIVRLDPPRGQAATGPADCLLIGLSDGTLERRVLTLTPTGTAEAYEVQPSSMTLSRGAFSLIPCTGTFMRNTGALQTTPNGTSFVLAASSRPSIITGTTRRLTHNQVNLPFDGMYGGAMGRLTVNGTAHDVLLVASPNGLSVCSLDPVQHMQAISYPIGELPRRIATHETTGLHAVGTIRVTTEGGVEGQQSALCLIDPASMDVLDRFEFDDHEVVSALMSTKLSGDNAEYLIAGTALAYPDEVEARQGRVLVFEVRSDGAKRVLGLVAQWTVSNLGVFDLCPFFDGRVVVALDSKVQLLRWDPTTKELLADIGYYGMALCVTVTSIGNRIIAGDVLKSVTVLQLNEEGISLEEVASDYNPVWTSAVHALDKDTFLVADTYRNIFIVRQDTHDEAKVLLKNIATFHLGEQVNVFAPAPVAEADGAAGEQGPGVAEVVYATVNGGVGTIYRIPADSFALLHAIEQVIAEVTVGVNVNIPHRFHRAFFSDKRPEIEPKGFIDGDVVEQFLSFPPDIQKHLLAKAGVTDVPVERVSDTIEWFSRGR